MSLAKRIHFAPLLVAALAVSLTGCYTLLRHPDVSDAYEFDDDQEIVIVSHCGDCHVSPMRHRPFRHMPVADDERDVVVPSRSIDPSTPARAGGGGIGPTLPGGSTTGDAKDAKTRDDSKGSSEKPPETIKKVAPDAKTPVRRDAAEKAAGDAEDKKPPEKKKETP